MKINESGSAMLMVMILIGATVGTTYYFMSQGQGQQKNQRIQMVNQAINSLSRTVKVALASKNICTHNLASFGVGQTFSKLSYTDGKDIIKIGPAYKTHIGDIKVSSIKIVQENSKNYLAVIYDTDPNDLSRQASSRYKGKKFELKGKMTSGKYNFCYHDETNLITNIAEDHCEGNDAGYFGQFSNWECTQGLIINSKVNTNKIYNCHTNKLYITYENGQITLKCNFY